MKKTFLLLIMSIALFGCGQDAIEEGMTPEEIEVIVAQAETSVESILSNAIEKDELVDPNDIANEIELLEGVVSAEASGSTILMNLTDGTELYYFFVDITDDKWFITNETKATQSEALKTKAITQTQTSDIIKPGGNGKALILAPFQFQLRTDLETISNILEDAGYITHPFINEDADIDIFRSSFLSIYDIVIIFTHGGSFEEDGKKNTMICTGEKVSRKRTKQLEADGQKGWNKVKAGGVSGTWYGITQEWLSETMPKDKFFHNTWVFVNGCETSVWDNLEGSLSKAFFDLGAEAYNGYKRIMYTSELQTASRFMIYNFCSGLSFMDAYEWTTNNFFSEKVLRLSDNEVSYVFDGLQKHASTPFYIVPPDGYQVLPSVEISSIDYTSNSSTCSCEVTYEGWGKVTARGVCWSTTEEPTIEDSKTEDGEGLGTYTSNITGLSPITTYYVRAYATNAEGTAYGEQRTFTTLDREYGSLTDSRDGNVYKTVTIGEQVWMAENLRYLPSVIGTKTSTTDSKCYYVYGYEGTDVDAAKATDNYKIYGVLYNYSAANASCPEGWHIPNDSEWERLATILGGKEVAGGKMKETGTAHWSSPNEGATNSSGFTALPGGYLRYQWYERRKTFSSIGTTGRFWSSTSWDGGSSSGKHTYGLTSSGTALWQSGYNQNYYGGSSLRCIRD